MMLATLIVIAAFAPTIVALWRRPRAWGWIVAWNPVVAFTVVGWFVLLWMAWNNPRARTAPRPIEREPTFARHGGLRADPAGRWGYRA